MLYFLDGWNDIRLLVARLFGYFDQDLSVFSLAEKNSTNLLVSAVQFGFSEDLLWNKVGLKS